MAKVFVYFNNLPSNTQIKPSSTVQIIVYLFDVISNLITFQVFSIFVKSFCHYYYMMINGFITC